MNEEAKQTHWQEADERVLCAMPEGTQVLTDRREVITKENGWWWQSNGIAANTKGIKKIIIIPEE
ncbi:MAG: hypothetical protein IJK84_10745 [Bacteroidales bacterium]|nr:hypothetical protein [Bacteroidales bacterium]MBQ7512668.1 hypothetical protein [Prevotella sp.]